MNNNNIEKLYDANNLYISTPHVFGMGRWELLHSYAALCKTKEKKREFALFVENIFAPTIKCLECRNHFLSMLEKYPVPFGSRRRPDEKDWSDEDSVFKWSFSIHNIVNQRLNKPILPWDVCIKLYDINNVCTQCYHQF